MTAAAEEPITDFTTPESWRPVDLTSYLDGTHVPPTTAVLFRSDGIGLFYPKRVHWIHGESESGKSWVAQLATVDTLNSGGRVLYVDFESTPDELTSRLILLGASPEDVLERFHYVQPLLSSDREPQAFSELLAVAYDFAVIDGVTESLGLYGAKSIDGDDVTTWGRKLPRRIARETGAATACIDHVTKSEDGRGRFAIGSQAKLALLDGAAYTVEPKDIAPGQAGILILRVAKDRGGQVRAHSGPFRAADRTQETARIRFDSTDPKRIKYAVEPFASFVDPETGESTFRPTYLMERISRWVQDNPDKSTREITTSVAGKKQALATALELLVKEGYVAATEYISRGATGKRHRSSRIYYEAQDPQSGKFHGRSEGVDLVPLLKEGGTGEPGRLQQPLTRFGNQVGNQEEPGSDLDKHREPGEAPGSFDQDQEPGGEPGHLARSTSDQQKQAIDPDDPGPPWGAREVSQTRPASRCERCRQPTEGLVLGRCRSCAYPTETLEEPPW